MKVGEYCRTDNGFISKYIGKNKNKWCTSGHLSFESTIRDISFEDFDEDNIIWESEIEQGFVKIKSSSNLIDLVEVGDYVNGNKIIEICDDFAGRKILVYGYDNGERQVAITIYEDEIKSIVTREMFESMEYKVKE